MDSPKKINSNLKVIAEMVVKDYLPLSFVEGDCFLNLMNIIVTFLPKDHEWDLMSDLSTVLGDLSEVATYMCSEKKLSLSEVYPIVCGLR